MPDCLPAVVADDADERRHAALAVRSRRQLLEALRSAGRPAAVGELAAATGLHVTTARTHLRVLEAAGLVVRALEEPVGPGRPRYVYASLTGGAAGEGHRQLAEVLAGALDAGGEKGRRRAEKAGRQWAEGEVPAGAAHSWEQAAAGLDELFGRLGFAPRRADADPGRLRIALDRCPFRDVARAHPQVVCAVHLGLMRGALARMGMPEVAASAALQPFVTPERCVAEISRSRPASDDTRGDSPSGR
ncbi:metalloregulator ArsR/SmtB family transcription factor [Blastococcus sp. TF02A-30]|uniref:helix-turn-helix transcriptional regulator n=1 Tax=Blastococcus sp. TF02A-30 TaxID=2250580 RepID=UPI000DE9C34A|nr:helix-turn-helix domain-containing protein [Blastococcus sp. TF02A-30]RBY84928.1 transcriptional regulator [Blastococcus sp. TF02A-30]